MSLTARQIRVNNCQHVLFANKAAIDFCLYSQSMSEGQFHREDNFRNSALYNLCMTTAKESKLLAFGFRTERIGPLILFSLR